MSAIAALAARQLEAYNRADLDAFCACYHPDVVVLDADGAVRQQGASAFRAAYAPMFARGGFGATVTHRHTVGPHGFDLESFWRDDPETGERIEGVVMVRYTLREDRIGLVQFFR